MACPFLEKNGRGLDGVGGQQGGGKRKDWEDSRERKQWPVCKIIIKIITKVMRDNY